MEKKTLQKIKEGDEEAFTDLFQNYSDYALRVATFTTKNQTMAADAVQETFIRVYRNIATYDLEKPFKPWFYRILINECYRIMKGKNETLPIEDLDSQAVQEDEFKFEKYEDLYSAIQSLNDLNRVPIVLKYLEDLSEKEIAEVIGINQNSVKSRLFKARQKLKEFLVGRGGL